MTRPRTPSDQKWLINERAIVLGELQAIEAEQARLDSRKVHLKNMLAALDDVYAQLVPVPASVAVPVVDAHARYGGRGNCLMWVREALKAAYPGAVDTAALTEAAAGFFGLRLTTPAERRRFRHNSLVPALRQLLLKNEAERLHDFQGVPHLAGVWRWVPPTAVFADIVAEAQALEADWASPGFPDGLLSPLSLAQSRPG